MMALLRMILNIARDSQHSELLALAGNSVCLTHRLFFMLLLLCYILNLIAVYYCIIIIVLIFISVFYCYYDFLNVCFIFVLELLFIIFKLLLYDCYAIIIQIIILRLDKLKAKVKKLYDKTHVLLYGFAHFEHGKLISNNYGEVLVNSCRNTLKNNYLFVTYYGS